MCLKYFVSPPPQRGQTKESLCQVQINLHIAPPIMSILKLARKSLLYSSTSNNEKIVMNNDNPFLQQPVDIILKIIDHLPLESAIAPGLTCRTLSYFVLEQACKRLAYDERREFRQLLEKDIGHR